MYNSPHNCWLHNRYSTRPAKGRRRQTGQKTTRGFRKRYRIGTMQFPIAGSALRASWSILRFSLDYCKLDGQTKAVVFIPVFLMAAKPPSTLTTL